jgi:hypothetical protein
MIKVASLFSQLLKHFPRPEFADLVRKHRAERHARGFDCWTQFVAMLFAQVSGADSLRTICNGLACCIGKLVHLGLGRAPNKSTLAYANEHRPAKLFEDLFWITLQRFRQQGYLGATMKKFRFKFKLRIFDATMISLCLGLFPWAKYKRAKGGIKLHVLLDHDDYMPEFMTLADAKQHEVKFARILKLNPGSIIAMDKAYADYSLFALWTEKGIFFVTRLKSNADFRVVKNLPVPHNRHILSDKLIRFTGITSQSKCPHLMRRVEVWDPENQRTIVLLTNHLNFGASTISFLYKRRWQIEIFFKTLKQNLKIKTFVGTSENALRIQIWTAMLALLLLKWLHFISEAKWSLSNLVSMLRLNLFTYRDLLEWLHYPFQTPPLIPGNLQLPLQFGQLATFTKGDLNLKPSF